MSTLNGQYTSSASWSQPGSLGPVANEDSSISTSQPSTALSSAMRDTGMASLSQDAAGWHQKMGKAFGYDAASPSPEQAASEAFRQELLKAIQTGDFSQLGLPIETVPGEQMGGRAAAFLGGDTATSADDRIVLNQDLLKQAAYDGTARAQLNAGIAEEVMHGLERKIHKGKSGDMQLNASGEIAFMESGRGRSFDEGKFARELATQPYHTFEDLKIASTVNDHGFVHINGEEFSAEFKGYNPSSHPIDEVANDNTKHSVRHRINKWKNAEINKAFDGPEAFAKIWHHHDNDQDLNGWLGKAKLDGSRGTTRGVTEFVGWVLDQADPVKAPKAHAEKQKILGEAGILGDNAWLNSRNNDEIDGSGSDTTQEISANLLKHVPATQLVVLEGTRAGTHNVQKAIGQQIAHDPNAFSNLQAHFSQGSNGADFLNKFTDDEIRTLNPHLLAAIPLEQINAAKGTRGVAALQKIFDPKVGGNGVYKNPGNWVNNEGELLSPGSQLLSNTAQTNIADELANNPDYKNLAAQAEQANVALQNKPTKHDIMGQQLASELFGEKGTDLTHMSNKEQQEYMDTLIASNADNPEELAASLYFPAETLAKAKAKNDGKLPANAGPLVQLLDQANTISTGVEDDLEASNSGRSLQNLAEVAKSPTLRNSLVHRILVKHPNLPQKTVIQAVDAGVAAAERSAATGGAAASSALFFVAATAALTWLGQNALSEIHGPEGGGGTVFNPNKQDPDLVNKILKPSKAIQEEIADTSLKNLNQTTPLDELKAPYDIGRFLNSEHAQDPLPNVGDTKAQKLYVENLFKDLGYDVSHDAAGRTFISNGSGPDSINVELRMQNGGENLATYRWDQTLIINPETLDNLKKGLVLAQARNGPGMQKGLDYARASLAGILVHELSHAMQHKALVDQGMNPTNIDNIIPYIELAAHWQQQEFLNEFLEHNPDIKYIAVSEVSRISDVPANIMETFNNIYGPDLERFVQAVLNYTNGKTPTEEEFIDFLKQSIDYNIS